MKRDVIKAGMLFAILMMLFAFGCENKAQEGKAGKEAKSEKKAVEKKAEAEKAVEPAKGQPKIHFEKAEYDAGAVKRGTNVVHEFVFKNIGDEVLNIRRAKGS